MWFERYVISRHKYSINLTQKNVTCVPGDQNLKFLHRHERMQEYCMVSIETSKTSEKSICAFHVMNCSRRRFKSRDRLPVWNPEGFRSDSIPGLEHPPGTIWYLKRTNRLRGWFESSYWEHRVFSHMRSCQCKNYIFWTTGTQVMIFYLEFIEDSRWEISHLSNYTSLGIKIFHIWKRHKRNIFHQKIGLLDHLEQY